MNNLYFYISVVTYFIPMVVSLIYIAYANAYDHKLGMQIKPINIVLCVLSAICPILNTVTFKVAVEEAYIGLKNKLEGE